MIGRTLTDIRAELEALTDSAGAYYVQCGRTGERPVPVDGRRFPDRASAVEAVRVAHAYRATLRRYDPRAPWYDFVVCEAGDDSVESRAWAFPPTGATGGDSRRALVAYCHDLAGAVFEALSASDHDAVERAVMDAYLDAAERTTDRDRLCLQLLATMATELQARLPAAARADALQRATVHLPAVPGSSAPVRDALDHLRTTGLLAEYDLVEGRWDRPRTVRIRGYELRAVEDRLPTLPLSAETVRRVPGHPPVVSGATRTDDGWRVTLSPAGRNPASASTAVRIDG
ncbi:DUF7551 domain-containing protein [Halosimplex salinum]|uniref:DUF7551 domain-containing protein n=1 Tax=Halosimplex salinum TaxID=1710538 RepID=UPI000F4AAD62|nr:hypothetical protein [Halosimplex salinum]